ncbi:MAG: class I SAM-dependent methyltransferase [Planctomycetota bacterium]|nr:class I SAM-dependent methyltransferase [Planctomycetota bacterium]
MAGKKKLSDDFYEKIKSRLHQRIGRELRLAGRILDLGCGACDLVQYLARAYRQKVTGIDISDHTFPKRRHTSDGRRFQCIRKNAKQLSFVKSASVDAVVSMWAFHEMEHPETILAEARRSLRPGGELLIVDFPKNSLAQKLWDERYYQPEELGRLLKKIEFKAIRVRLIEQKQIIWARGFRPPATSPSEPK